MKLKLIAVILSVCLPAIVAINSVSFAQNNQQRPKQKAATPSNIVAATSNNLYVPISKAIAYELDNISEPLLGLNKAYVKSLSPGNGTWEIGSEFSRAFIQIGAYPPGIEYNLIFETSNLDCLQTDKLGHQATCTYNIETSGLLRWLFKTRLGDYMAVDLASGPARRKDRFIYENGVWTSPDIRNSMLKGISQIKPSGGSTNGMQNQLCRSLGAGVVASGGSSDSQKMHSAAGC